MCNLLASFFRSADVFADLSRVSLTSGLSPASLFNRCGKILDGDRYIVGRGTDRRAQEEISETDRHGGKIEIY